MREINLDATDWKTISDFYDALLPALGTPEWHGTGINAMLDTMIWNDVNAVKPPYVVRVHSTKGMAGEIMNEIILLRDCLVEHRDDFLAQHEYVRDVSLEIVS